jgi:N6-adenosine-specific RNA methylase IME4
MNVLQSFIDLRPSGGFSLIMADPPWRFDNWSEAGEEKNATAHYGCEGIDWIKSLPVSALAAPDCLLWLWATNPMLPEALACIDAWGFTYKTAGTWVKRTTRGKDAFGTGYVLRSANEPFLIATRRAPKTTRSTRSTIPTYDDGFHSVANGGDWPAGSITIEGRVGAHSEKPEEGYAACDGLMPGARKLELFSRKNRPGWSAWGNETGKLDMPQEGVPS